MFDRKWTPPRRIAFLWRCLLLVVGLISASASGQFEEVSATAARIGVSAETLARVRDGKFGYVLRTQVWLDQNQKPLRALTVCWEDAESPQNSRQRELVRKAIAETWQRYSLIQFTGWKTCPTGEHFNIRIKVADVGAYTKGLGNELDDISGGMVLNFQFKTWSQRCMSNQTLYQMCVRSIAVHEFGHALGIAHEQNRDDRLSSCDKPPQGKNGDTKLTPYDPDSVMNYCNLDYNNFGKLSYYDVITVQSVYGVPPENAQPGLKSLGGSG